MNKFKLIQLLNKLELAVGETVMAKKVKENINELILDVKNEAINYTHSCESDSEQLVCNYCLEKTNTLPDDFGCQSCIDNYK
jgi:hypothetical protein